MNSSLRDEDYIKFLQDQGTLLDCLFDHWKEAFTKAWLAYNFVYSETIDIPSPRPPIDMFIIQEKTIIKLSKLILKLIDNANVEIYGV